MPPNVALPPLPQALKPIQSYIQRAEELTAKDPVMSYWCYYYAAQMGLDLKSHEVGARDYLYSLIAVLETMKKDLGANDAVENEAAGAAYVENFAIKVFNMADNEDRRGQVTRSTAKKFLAAANFLELLKVFEKNENAKVNEEKVRYAKWKASDIAKAFREGRKPTPGGSGAAPSDDDFQTISSTLDTPYSRTLGELTPNAGASPLPTETAGRTPGTRSRQLPDELNLSSASVPPKSPTAWSTAATPGGGEFPGQSSTATKQAFTNAMNHWKSQNDGATPTGPTKADAIDANANARGPSMADIMAKKTVHFSPSVVGGLPTDGSAPNSPDVEHLVSPHSYFSQHDHQQYRPGPGPGPSSLGRVDPVMAPLPDSSPSGSSRTSSENSPRHGVGRPTGRPRSGSSPPLPAGGSPPGMGAQQQHQRTSPPSGHSRRLSLQQSPPVVPANIGHKRSSSASRSSPPQGSQSYLQPSPSVPPGSRSPTAPGFVNLSPRAGPVSGLPPAPAPGSYATMGPYRPSNGNGNGNGAPGIPGQNQKAPSPPSRFTAPGPSPRIPSSAPLHPPPNLSSPQAQAPKLTPADIARAQKHARFAISALEYEDVERARQDLRTALAVLGDF